MTWYYAQDGERKGPFEQPEFETLVSDGTIGSHTPVWKEGMMDWQPYAELVASPGAMATRVLVPRVTLGLARVACSSCGQTLRADQGIHLGGATVCPDCKPHVVESLQRAAPLQNDGAEQLRKTHFRHEASVKSVPLLYFFLGGLLAMVGFGSVFSTKHAAASTGRPLFDLAVLTVAAVLIWTGIGLRKLRPWSRVSTAIVSCFGLLFFPLGTLVNGYILYLLFSAKGAMVFSEPYQRAIVATPHMKYRISTPVWVVLGLFISLLVFSCFCRLMLRPIIVLQHG